MALSFRYYFGGHPISYSNGNSDWADEEEFIYEADWEEASDYILRTHEASDILKDYIDNGMYDELGTESKEILSTYDGFDGTYDSIEKMSEEVQKELAQELMLDLLDTDVYEDELQDYFEQDAYDEWEESHS